MASDGAKHISFSQFGTWQWQKKLCTIQNKIPAMVKIASTYKRVCIKYLNPV
jgi:hypothetical protein